MERHNTLQLETRLLDMDTNYGRDQSGRPPRSRSRFVGKSGRLPRSRSRFVGKSGRPPRSRSRFVGKSGRPPRTCKIFEASREKSRQIRKSRGNPDFSRLFAQNREKSRCYPTFLDFSRFFPTFPGVFDLKRTGKLGENLDFPRFCPGNSRTVISTRSRFVGKSG